jgi:hypothetical protein
MTAFLGGRMGGLVLCAAAAALNRNCFDAHVFETVPELGTNSRKIILICFMPWLPSREKDVASRPSVKNQNGWLNSLNQGFFPGFICINPNANEARQCTAHRIHNYLLVRNAWCACRINA